MSTFYPDLTLTQFPDRIDGRYLMIDPSTPEHIQWIAEYNACIDAGDMDGAIAVLEAHEDLRKMFFNAAKWNRHDDMIIALEKFFYQDVEEYLMDIVAWRGEWSPTTPYTKYDVVYYMHDEAYETYMGIVRDIPTGTLPTDTDYFVPITLRGQKGESGIGLTWRGAWKPQIQYYTDDCAVYDGKIYAAKQDSMGDRPDISPSSWEPALWFNADSLTGIVKVENGGTGNDTLARGYVFEGNGQAPMIAHKIATTTPTAQSTDLLTSGIAYDKFLTKADNAVIVNVTVPASGWVNYQQTVTVQGVNNTNVVIASLQHGANREQRDVCWNATISIMGQGVNSVTLVCDGLLPRIDLPLTFAIMGEEGTTQADTVTDSLAQIQENASDIASLGSDIENMRQDINDNLTQQDEELMKRAGSLIDTIESNNNSVTFIADDTGSSLTSLKIEGAHQYSSDEYSPTAPRTLTTTGQYDAMITLDGGDSQNWSGRGGTMNYFQLALENAAKLPAVTGTPGITNSELASYGEIGSATQVADRVYVYTSGTRLIARINVQGVTTVDDLKAYLQAKPLTIWYQSVDFVAANQVYFGIKVVDSEGAHGYVVGPTKPLLTGDTLDFITGEITRQSDYYAMDGVNETVVMSNGLFRSVNGTGEDSRVLGSSTHYNVTINAPTMPSDSIRRRTDSRIEISDSRQASAVAYNTFLSESKTEGTPLKMVFTRNETLTEQIEPLKLKVRGETTISIANPLPLHMAVEYPRALKDRFDEVQTEFQYTDFDFLRCFHKFCGIGDSLMAGFTQIDGVTEDSTKGVNSGNNWFQYLMTRLNREGTNLAIGSSTTHNWRYGSQGSYPSTNLPGANIDGIDCYLVGLGVNDLIKPAENTIGTSADIHTDYTVNADSTYGNLDFVIHKLAEYKPYAKVFVFTIPWYGDKDTTDVNAAIRYVCSINSNAYCIDLAAIDGFVDDFAKANFTGGHFNPLTYNLYSARIEKAINRYIYEHYTDLVWIPYKH